MLVALAGDHLEGKPTKYPKLQVLSPVELERHAGYDGPTWLDQAILSKWRPDASTRGFAAEVDGALAARGRWLVARQLAEAAPGGEIIPKPDMMRRLRQAETQRLAEDLSPPSQRVLPARRAWTADCRPVRARHHHADGQARCHPAAGHLHAGPLEAGPRTLQGARHNWHDRPDTGHLGA